MRSRHGQRRAFWGAGLLTAALALSLVTGLSLSRGEEFPKDLGGDERYVTHVSTDKPIYREGESVYIRSVMLHAHKFTPFKHGGWGTAKVKSPMGAVVFSGGFSFQDGVGGAKWTIPEGTPGGEYTVEINTGFGHPKSVRKFDIRAYRAPRLKNQLEFVRKGYGPGEEVAAILHSKRAEGGVPAGAKVTAIARVDGREVWRGSTRLDAEGSCVVRFKLPARIKQGVGTLALVIEDGGTVETAAKTIPILLQTIPMVAYPEGGDLVAGLNCGLYLEALTPWGDPADLTAEIVDDKGKVVATIKTEHEGRGRTAFTPVAGRSYSVKVVKPRGITTQLKLPAVKEAGASLRAAARVFEASEAIEFHAAATKGGKYRLALAIREKEVASISVKLEAGKESMLSLMPTTGAEGVLRATLYDPDNKPVAERLVFRRPERQLKIEITATPKNAVPGDKIVLRIKTTGPDGKPVSAVVGLTVTDDSVLEMIEKRKQAPRLPVMALLESEVDHLEDAQIYLSDDPKAATAIDLLLGTQGWRRFAFADPEEFVKEFEDKAKRVLALKVPVIHEFPVEDGAGGGFPRPRAAPGRKGGDGKPEGKNGDANKQPVGRAASKAPEPRRMRKAVGGDQKRPAEEKARADADDLEREPMMPAAMVRVYAHQLLPGRKPGDRADFTETLYWHAGVRTNKQGEAKVEFFLNDAISSFRVMADGYTEQGALGQADALITSRQPFYLEPKLPLEVTAGDTVLIPVTLVNSTGGKVTVKLGAEAGEGIALPENFAGEIELTTDERGRYFIPVRVLRINGKVKLTLTGKAGAFSDRVTREISVRPAGFPIHFSVGGMLTSDAPQACTFVVPQEVHLSTVTTACKVYPTPMANLAEALEALIREPGG